MIESDTSRPTITAEEVDDLEGWTDASDPRPHGSETPCPWCPGGTPHLTGRSLILALRAAWDDTNAMGAQIDWCLRRLPEDVQADFDALAASENPRWDL